MARTGLLILGGIAVIGGAFLFKAKRASEKLETRMRAYIPEGGLSAQGLMIGLDIHLTNPTNGKLRIKYPFVKVTFGGYKIGENAIQNKDVVIPAQTTVRLRDQLGEDVTVIVPVQAVIGTLGGAVGAVISGAQDSLDITIETTTTAFAPGIPTGIPYTDKQVIPLKKAQETAA